VGVITFLTGPTPRSVAQDTTREDLEGVEVLTQGPLHEAYAAVPTLEPKPGVVASKQPPDPIEELPPDQKPEGENVQWIPGYFHWDEERNDFIWISGFWRVPPPNKQWVPGAWRQVEGGWQWNSGYWVSTEVKQVEFLPPPPAPLQTASIPAPGPDYSYAPGTWVYNDYRYAWRPGFWYVYRPGWVFVPAHYVWTPYGYVFVDGYWDYPLRERGIIFAPVFFARTVYVRPAFVYRPSYVIYDDALYGAMFVRPGYCSYWFGDYFEARYTRLGYRSWTDVRIGFNSYEPLYSYYRYSYRSTPGWETNIRTVYTGRYNGTYPRPPRTLVQQTTIVNNNTTIVNNKTILNNVVVAAPLTKV